MKLSFFEIEKKGEIFMEQPTIAAISTPHAMGGIGIVRLSGPDAREIASRVFTPKSARATPWSAPQ